MRARVHICGFWGPIRAAATGSRGGRGQNGFTLIELLVVLVILVLLASLVGPRVIGYLGSSRTKAAKIQVESLSSALELFKLDIGRYPTTSEGLKALVEAPGGASGWSGPYLTKREVPNDPWGRPYNYRSDGLASFDIFSLGADNQPGGSGENEDVYSRSSR
jgi:general secretion pathway protein G